MTKVTAGDVATQIRVIEGFLAENEGLFVEEEWFPSNEEGLAALVQLLKAHALLCGLRRAYRGAPHVFRDHLESLKKLSEETRRRLVLTQDLLVARYEELAAQRRALEGACDVVHAALVDICKFDGSSEVELGEGILVASRTTYPELPAKRAPERNELERLLKENGLWDNVTYLNGRRLQGLITGGEIREDVRKALLRLCPGRQSYQLRLRPLAGSDDALWDAIKGRADSSDVDVGEILEDADMSAEEDETIYRDLLGDQDDWARSSEYGWYYEDDE